MSSIEVNVLLFAYFIKPIAVLMFMDPGNTVLKNFDLFCRSVARLLLQRVKSHKLASNPSSWQVTVFVQY